VVVDVVEVGVVAVVVVDVVEVVVLDVVVGVVVVDAVVDGVLDTVLDVFEVGAGFWWQSRTASEETVATPLSRSWRNVTSTVSGRFSTFLFS
jgi:hypothetical protein